MELDFGNNQNLSYHYDGSGRKLTKVNTPGAYYPTNTEYRGQMVHQSSNGTSSLKYIITPEGRLLNTGTNAAPVWGWEYDLKDHLGNVRVIFKPNATNNGVVRVEYANYFPFGMKMLAPYSTFSGAKYLYNGKEYQDDFGLNWYDYGARFYDATLGRWHSVDPLAEKYRRWSPYTYGVDNPMRFIDPDGMEVVAADEESKRNIKNTLTKRESKYVRFNKDGTLNDRRLNRSKSTSENMIALKAESKSATKYIYKVASEYKSAESSIPKALVGDPSKGTVGVTLLPGADVDASPDNNVYIYTSNKASEKKQAENTAHEGYGHAYFFEKTKDVTKSSHTSESVEGPKFWDDEFKVWGYTSIKVQTNIPLEEQIKVVVKQASENYEANH